jgi:hypothetical protein
MEDTIVSIQKLEIKGGLEWFVFKKHSQNARKRRLQFFASNQFHECRHKRQSEHFLLNKTNGQVVQGDFSRT